MRVIRREFFNVACSDEFRIVPIGDIHLGAAACDEARFKRVVQAIAETPHCYWIGMGDCIDAINRSDPRFSPSTLASWIRVGDLGDLAKAQRDHFLDLVAPIAPRCLALLEGNHRNRPQGTPRFKRGGEWGRMAPTRSIAKICICLVLMYT